MEFTSKEGDRITTVESKLELFEKMVLENELIDDRTALKELEAQNTRALETLKLDCRKQRKEYVEKMKAKASDDAVKIRMKAEAETRMLILKKREALRRQLSRELLDRLRDFAQSEAYEAYFKRVWNEALKMLAGGGSLFVGVNPRDLDRIEGNVEKTGDESVIGGFYMIQDGAVRYDFTLNRETEKVLPDLGAKLKALLDSMEVESHDEE